MSHKVSITKCRYTSSPYYQEDILRERKKLEKLLDERRNLRKQSTMVLLTKREKLNFRIFKQRLVLETLLNYDVIRLKSAEDYDKPLLSKRSLRIKQLEKAPNHI